MNRQTVPLVLLAATIPLLGYAWGQNGHRVIGQIAQRHLTPQASSEVRRLLGAETLAQISTWSDEIRSDASWRCAAPFHYVTLPPETDYFGNFARGGDAIRAIVYFEDVLSNPNSSLGDRQRALKFLVHIVGDLHQPLHSGRGCDLGGNQVRVSWFGESVNLHTVWDARLVESENLSYSEMTDFLDRAPPEQVTAYQQASPLEWAHEAQQHLDNAYTCHAGDRCPCFCGQCEQGRSVFGGCTTSSCALKMSGDVQLGYQYIAHNLPIVREQLHKGGLRLAGLLNWALDDRVGAPAAYVELKRKITAIEGWADSLQACTANR